LKASIVGATLTWKDRVQNRRPWRPPPSLRFDLLISFSIAFVCELVISMHRSTEEHCGHCWAAHLPCPYSVLSMRRDRTFRHDQQLVSYLYRSMHMQGASHNGSACCSCRCMSRQQFLRGYHAPDNIRRKACNAILVSENWYHRICTRQLRRLLPRFLSSTALAASSPKPSSCVWPRRQQNVHLKQAASFHEAKSRDMT